MDKKITDQIRNLFVDNNINFREVDHEPAPTCELSANARGESQHAGGKTLLLKDKKGFKLFVISAVLEADSKAIRKILRSPKLRFATEEELLDLAGVVKGALPPFGRPILPFDLYIDESIFKNEIIAFNAGILTKSFILKVEDYLKLIEPIKCSFARSLI